MLLKKQILTLSLISAFSIILSAQELVEKTPKKAGIYSALIPGAGQIYTEKYWKVPIIYAGIITSAYYIKESNSSYTVYKDAYIKRLEGNNSDDIFSQYSNNELSTICNHYRRNREVSILFLIGTYILNIVDASVSAHLFNYDISDNLTINIQPIYISNEKTTGVLLSFNL